VSAKHGIETARLTLRPFAEADRAAFAAIVADPQVAYWLGGARVQDPAYFDNMLTFRDAGGRSALAIVRREDGVLLGRVNLRRLPEAWNHPMSGETEVGWSLARHAWGRGYATEAARAMLDLGFSDPALPTIHAWTSEGNHRSQAVMQRLGMVRALERDFDFPDAAQDDPLRRSLVFAIARSAT
jgi:RimJ/RimL family protein N-acetyltransferase